MFIPQLSDTNPRQVEVTAKEILPGWLVFCFCCFCSSYFFSHFSSPAQHIYFTSWSQNYGLPLTSHSHSCRPKRVWGWAFTRDHCASVSVLLCMRHIQQCVLLMSSWMRWSLTLGTLLGSVRNNYMHNPNDWLIEGALVKGFLGSLGHLWFMMRVSPAEQAQWPRGWIWNVFRRVGGDWRLLLSFTQFVSFRLLASQEGKELEST